MGTNTAVTDVDSLMRKVVVMLPGQNIVLAASAVACAH